MFCVSGAGDLLGFTVSLTIPSLVAALCINGVGIGGQQVVGVVDALHEASRAGYPENAATQGLVAGMWSSLSGAGRCINCTHVRDHNRFCFCPGSSAALVLASWWMGTGFPQ